LFSDSEVGVTERHGYGFNHEFSDPVTREDIVLCESVQRELRSSMDI